MNAPTRRGLLGGAGALAAASAASFAEVGTTSDPTIPVHARYQAVEDALAEVERQHAELYKGFVQRHGAIVRQAGYTAYRPAWEADPLHPELTALVDRSDELTSESGQLTDQMRDVPAILLAGIRCKLLTAVDLLAHTERKENGPDYHEEAVLAYLRDAVRVLDGSAVA